ncbi:MAG: SIMPL domain-containing protein [Aestuariivirgaceae bacterium]|nr:SIMPL domain-containing protein [Aestuariivirgaceae bacterium]
MRRTLTLSALAICAFMSAAAHADMPPPPPRTLTMQGSGEVMATPDMASLSMGVTSFAEKARDALDANTAAMTKILTGLKAAGLADKDLQTSGFSLNPRMTYDPNNAQPPKLEGYEVNNQLSIVIRNLDKLGTVIDSAVSDGSNNVNGISFGLSDPQATADEARRKAYADAERKARLYAQMAGLKLAEVISLSETSGYEPRPMRMQMDAMVAKSAPVPVAPGEQSVGMDVTVTWRLE